ncbi:phage tail sheath family protein [Cetobacterium sp.]|uniref:phage tail sheath family protein n=1 Tax=Cetobacterium sp. TaxID=2071632 RepID=UPI003EE790C9
MFQHGSYSKEVPTSLRGMVSAKNPILVVGTAPINMGDITNVNRAQLVTSAEEAMKYFGGTSDLSFTISEVLDACLNLYNVKPIVAINVLDPSKHKTEKTKSAIVVTENKVTLEESGIILSTLTVKIASQQEALPQDKYNAYFNNSGKVIIEIIGEGIPQIDVEYSFLDISKVTKSDILGGIDPNTLEKQGFECIDEVFNKYSMIPGLIIAPGFSHEPEVKAIIEAKASSINSKYGAMGIVDLPEETQYGDAILKKKELNIVDEDLLLCFGKGKLGDKIYHMSTLAAGSMSSIDAGNDGVPYESPSNKNLKVNALVIKTNEGYKEILLDEEQQANLLNENGIVTAIRRSNGFVLWGNRTAAYQPGGSTDPKDIWIPIKRMFKYISNVIIMNTAQDVDKPMTYSRAELIQNTVNVYLAGLVSAQKLLGGRIEFLREENPLGDMLEGKFKWHIYIGAVLPGESLHFILEYDPSYQEVTMEKLAA